MTALQGSFTLPVASGSASDKPPIYVRLSPENLLALRADMALLIAQGSSQTIRIGDGVHELDPVDDPSTFDIVSRGPNQLKFLGPTAVRYTVRSDLDSASSRLRKRTEAAELERESHRAVQLSTVGTDKRGRSVSPAARPSSRTTSPAPHSLESLSKPRGPTRLVADQRSSSPARRTKSAEEGSSRSPAKIDTSSSVSSTSSNDTSSTKQTSVSPPARDKRVIPEVTVSSPVNSSKEPIDAPTHERKRSFDLLSDSDDPRGRAHKAPRVVATTASGTRVSKPLRRSSSSGRSGDERSASPAARPVVSMDAAPSSDAAPEDSAALRAAALASVSVKKRKLSSGGRTPTGSRGGTPEGSRPSTPGAATKKHSRDPREEVWYTSSEDEGIANGSPESRGRKADTKKLANRRVAELASHDEPSSRLSSPASRTSSSNKSRTLHSRQSSDVSLPPLEIHSAHEFAEMAAKFDKDLAHFESERKRLVELRADVQVALKSGQRTVPREGGLLHIGRGDISEASKRARRRYEELSQVKTALQSWIDEHP